MKYAKRVDGNHAQIRDGLRKAGYRVRDHSALGDGIPDLCVLAVAPLGISLHLEVKDPNNPNKARHQLTDAEKEWMYFNGWNTRKVFTLDEALAAITQFKREVSCMLTKPTA
jgi:hypothetical protein